MAEGSAEQERQWNPEDSYRVFVSYSREDADNAHKIVRHLENIGLHVLWDRGLKPGRGFTESIQEFISHARLFIPLITPESLKHGWVQHEVGYALGQNVPILPVSLGALPEGIIEFKQACVLREDLEDLATKLARDEIDIIVEDAERELPPYFECARTHTKRGIMITQYANTVRRIHAFQRVRQRGALTTFQIPEIPYPNRCWDDRYDGAMPSEDHCESLYEERRALERHAREAGCALIVQPLLPQYLPNPETGRSFRSWCTRVETLARFLSSMPKEDVQVFVQKDTPDTNHSLTMVGDWYSAEAITLDQRGFRHTILTRNPCVVRKQIEQFDTELASHFARNSIDPADSRDVAVATLESLIEKQRP